MYFHINLLTELFVVVIANILVIIQDCGDEPSPIAQHINILFFVNIDINLLKFSEDCITR